MHFLKLRYFSRKANLGKLYRIEFQAFCIHFIELAQQMKKKCRCQDVETILRSNCTTLILNSSEATKKLVIVKRR